MNKMFLDVETTGLGNNAAIIEIAAIAMVDGEEKHHFHSMVRPHEGSALDPKAFEITGIDIKEIWSYPDPKEVINEFLSYIDSFECVFSISGHNISFDRNKLFRFFCLHGHYSSFITRFHNVDYCTLKKSRELFKGKRNKPSAFNLKELCEYFDIQTDVSHRALADIQNTIKVYYKLDELDKKIDIKEESIPYVEKKRKYLDMRYIQMNPEGDIFLTTDATKDKFAMRFILNHLYEMYAQE